MVSSMLHGGGLSQRSSAAACWAAATPANTQSLLAPAARSRTRRRACALPQPLCREDSWHAASSVAAILRSGRRVSCSAHSAVASYTHSFEEEMGWRTDFGKQYVHGRLLGQGSFGSVYLGVDLRTGGEVAVKVLPKVRGKLSREKTLEKLAKEVDILERLQGCPGVVKLEDVFEDTDTVSIVTELCSGGDLQQYAEARGSLDERALAHVAIEVLRIVKACHDAGLLHGDVKPANFCLKHPTLNPLASPQHDFTHTMSSSWLKAIDFGCSQLLPVHRRLSKRTGTPVYMAPETYGRDYHKEADMWSVGVMLYQLYAKRFPFWDTIEGCKASQLDEVAHAVSNADITYNYGPWLHMSAEGRSFVSGCLQRNPALRLSVQEALQHPWLTRMLTMPATAQAQQYVQQQQPQPQAPVPGAWAPVYQQHIPRIRPQPMAAPGPTPYHQAAQQAAALRQQQQQQQTATRVGALVNAVAAPAAA